MANNLTLVLGAGGARGLAHIGVLKVLEENNIRPDKIIGSSMGALIGVLYADGKPAKELEKIVFSTKLLNFFQLKFYQGNILDGEKIRSFLRQNLSVRTFEELKIPLTVTAFDVNNGKQLRINKGLVEDGVIPSISLPGLLKPYYKDGAYLVDAGIVNPLPVDLARGNSTVIGVNVSPEIKDVDENSTLTEIVTKAMYTVQSHTKKPKPKKSGSSIILRPVLGNIRLLDFRREHEIIMAGEKAVREKLEEIKLLLGK